MRGLVQGQTLEQNLRYGWNASEAENVLIGWVGGVQVEIGELTHDRDGKPIKGRPIGVRIEGGKWVPLERLREHVSNLLHVGKPELK